jgi:hypothetical protein
MDFQEGPNPVVVQSKGQRKKVCALEKARIAHDDVLELIPGDYFMKYVSLSDEHKSSAAMDLGSIKKEKRHSEEDSAAVKRNRQIMEDEALARTLQVSLYSVFVQNHSCNAHLTVTGQSMIWVIFKLKCRSYCQ